MIRSMFKSRVNQPSRAFVNSNDDVSNQGSIGFNSFRCTLQTPILNSTKVQLLRATIPNAQINIPDYCLTFWYYNLTAGSPNPSDSTLRCVRLYPSTYVPPSGFTNYTKNRYVTDPADLVTLLNAAAASTGDSATYNSYFTGGDVSFAYNSTTKQITMTGLTSGSSYAIAGWNDPFVRAAMLRTTGKQILLHSFNGSDTYQQWIVGYTLNLRVGYAMSGTSLAPQNTVGNPLYANLTNTTFAQNAGIPPDAYPNLVYTGSVYLYSDIVAGSSIGSGSQHDLLAVIPNNTAQFGVIQYVAATLTWLTKVPDTVYEINIRMFDDANQPFTLADNAVVNVELGIGYD
jgi:hypothetical protein